jgi:hypothetical protein
MMNSQNNNLDYNILNGNIIIDNYIVRSEFASRGLTCYHIFFLDTTNIIQ